MDSLRPLCPINEHRVLIWPHFIESNGVYIQCNSITRGGWRTPHSHHSIVRSGGSFLVRYNPNPDNLIIIYEEKEKQYMVKNEQTNIDRMMERVGIRCTQTNDTSTAINLTTSVQLYDKLSLTELHNTHVCEKPIWEQNLDHHHSGQRQSDMSWPGIWYRMQYPPSDF